MTLADAWRELGLDPGADPETVRRAYLRFVKTRKPEQDPAGFQRLRDAYEIARAGGLFERMVVARTRPDPEAGSTPSPGASRGARPSVEPDVPDDAPASGDAFERFAHASSRLPQSGDQTERLKVAREALAALPDDPRAHWLLASALSRSDSEEALAEALRIAWRKGWPEFLEALLVRVPDRTKHDDVEAAFASDRPTLRLAAAAVAARWASRRAARVVEDLCRTATEAPLDAKRDHVRSLPIAQMLDVVLALQAAGAVDPAAEAHAALRACLHDSGRELGLLQTPLGHVWILAEEIDGLPREFPPLLREAFARGAREGDLAVAFWETRVAIAHNPGAVERWVAHLSASAVNVTDTMRAALAYVPPAVPPPTLRSSLRSLGYHALAVGVVVAIAVAFALLLPKDPPPPLH